MEEEVRFQSEGLKLAGVLNVPDGRKAGERLPVFVIAHGFGSHKGAGNVLSLVKMLGGWGYATLRFDMRGCGESEGERGRLICLEQVADTQSAISFLETREEIDPKRIALIGSSFGAAVVLYTGGIDKRVAAVVSSGGWGHGERKFRGQHPTPEAWEKFTGILAKGKAHKEKTGESLWVDRYDIVPIPEHLRHNVLKGSIDEFPVDTAQSMYDFRAEDVIAGLSPRPLLLLHSSVDSVTPTEQSIGLFNAAGKPKDLHFFNETDHFMFAEGNTRVFSTVKAWLDMYFPVKPGAA
ncbi:MAG: hypothetical protein RLZ98_835 [Pseudomonadota bacterium]|jgi:alpha-beta hydrolase superfamily lysophospholipase